MLAKQWELRYLDRSGISFDAAALAKLSREEATRLEALPMHVDRDGMMVVALAEPTEARLSALRALLGDRIAPVVVAKTALDRGLNGGPLARHGNGADTDQTEMTVEDAAPIDMSTREEAASAAADEAPDFSERGAREPVSVVDDSFGASDDFDHAAQAMVADLTAHLASLGKLVEDERSTRERDQAEIGRLESELDKRDGTIRQLQQTLRQLADNLDPPEH